MKGRLLNQTRLTIKDYHLLEARKIMQNKLFCREPKLLKRLMKYFHEIEISFKEVLDI